MESVFSRSPIWTMESCHYQCLKAVCGVLGYPKGAAAEFLDGTLKLRHCTTIFTTRFPPWSLPSVGNGGGKRQFVTPGHLSDAGSNVDKRVRLTRKTRPGASSHVIPDPGHPTPRRWKRLRRPPPKERGVRLADLAMSLLCWVVQVLRCCRGEDLGAPTVAAR